ncbi:MAG: hypothetical protein MZW92_79985 [Comamonadaceae bacterium]|nr:hypothetical protein [Comamonadaceae bacterium]
MAFVTGPDGAVHEPDPDQRQSMGMLISLAIAFVVTPWLALKLMRRHAHGGTATGRTS